MLKYVRSWWVTLPVVLSIVFVVLFYPVVSQRYSLPASLGFTVIGLCVIWAVYFIRASIFTRLSQPSADKKQSDDRG